MPRLSTKVPTPKEEAAIRRGIAFDADNPELTDDDFARMRPASEVLPDIVARFRRARGKQKAPTKIAVSIRLDSDLAAALRESGQGWQTRANDILKKAVLG